MVVRRFAFAFLVLSVSLFCINVVSAIPISSCQTISSSGSYEITQDLSTDFGGNCIYIQSGTNNVYVNGNGFRIINIIAPASTGYPLRINGVSDNITFDNIEIVPSDRGISTIESNNGFSSNVTFSQIYIENGNFKLTSYGGTTIKDVIINNSRTVSLQAGTWVDLGISASGNGFTNLTFDNLRIIHNLSSPAYISGSIKSVKLTGNNWQNHSWTIRNSQIDRFLITPSGSPLINSLPMMTFGTQPYGQVSFLYPLPIHPLNSGVNFSGYDSSPVVVTNNRAFITSNPLYYNIPARITLNGITGVTNPQIMRSGGTCGYDCVMESFSGGTAVFRVGGSGEYSVVQAGSGGGNNSPWDYNRDGTVNVSDIFAFLADWFAHQ